MKTKIASRVPRPLGSFGRGALVIAAMGAALGCSGNDGNANAGGSGGASTNSASGSGGNGGQGGSSADGGSTATGGSGPASGGSSATGGSGGAGGGCGSISGEAMPTDDLPGYKLVFSDDFTVDAPLGSFPGSAYSAGWSAYPEGWHDTSGNGHYSPEKTLSVTCGALSIHVHSEDGTHYVSAPEPMKGMGQTYGRYAVRFRATQMTGDYKTAWLLWPDSGKWPDDGEIDFPEGNLDSTISAFAHHANPAGGQDAFPTQVTYSSWHTAIVEWSSEHVQFTLDDKVIGTSTTEVPNKAMHWVLQTETRLSGGAPSDTSEGNLEIDWVAIWSKK